MKPHLARHMFVGYMCSQGSLALAEYAAYTACHSQEIQQSTYLDGESKRLIQLIGMTYYHEKVAGGGRMRANKIFKMSGEAEKDFIADTNKVSGQNWKKYLEEAKEIDQKSQTHNSRCDIPHS